MTAHVEIESATAGYGDSAVLHEINLRVQPGEAVAMIGPNGSGKSTLLNLIAGALPPRTGTVRLNNRSSTSISARELAQMLAYVPQDEQPAFSFTVREVVAMGRLARSQGIFETKEDELAVDAALERCHCLGYAGRTMAEISGGERQRALIARALCQEADLLLLDEPTSHLDVAHQIEVCRLIRTVSEARGTVITAIHDLNLLHQVADRAILIHEGKLCLDASVTEVLHSPMLDQVFGVTFTRLEIDGRVAVFPVFA